MSLKERTANNVHATFVEEAKAAVRFLLFAERAESEGLPQIASLFRAVAGRGYPCKKALCIIERQYRGYTE